MTLPYWMTGPLSKLDRNSSPAASDSRRAIDPSAPRKLNMWPLRDVYGFFAPFTTVSAPLLAATAIAQGVPLVTQDEDYVDVPGLEVIHV